MDVGFAGKRVLRLPEVLKMTGISRASVYKRLKEGTFPQPIRLGPRTVGWRLSDLDLWLSSPEREWKPPPT